MGRAMGKVMDDDGARRRDLAAIHIAKSALGWDDDTYRDVMFTVCRVRSSAELDFAGRKTWLAHLRACVQAGGRMPAASAAPRPVKGALSPHQKLMWSLWQQLADARKVNQRGMHALVAYAKRQTGVDRLEWLNAKQEDLVIASLRRWLER